MAKNLSSFILISHKKKVFLGVFFLFLCSFYTTEVFAPSNQQVPAEKSAYNLRRREEKRKAETPSDIESEENEERALAEARKRSRLLNQSEDDSAAGGSSGAGPAIEVNTSMDHASGASRKRSGKRSESSSKSRRLNPEESGEVIEQLTKGIQEINNRVEAFGDQETLSNGVTVFLGNTGAGKTTILHHTVGNSLRVVQSKKGNGLVFELANKTDEDCGLIPDTHISQTALPLMKGRCFDCPGFNDSRGPIQEILNAWSIHRVFSLKPEVRIVLVVSAGELMATRAEKFLAILKTLEETFVSREITNGLSLVVTQGSREGKDCGNNLDAFKQKMGSIKDEVGSQLSSFQEEILNFLEKKADSRVSFFSKPLQEQLDQELPLEPKLIKETPYMKNIEAGISVSSDAKDYLNKMMQTVTEDLKNVYKRILDYIKISLDTLLSKQVPYVLASFPEDQKLEKNVVYLQDGEEGKINYTVLNSAGISQKGSITKEDYHSDLPFNIANLIENPPKVLEILREKGPLEKTFEKADQLRLFLREASSLLGGIIKRSDKGYKECEVLPNLYQEDASVVEGIFRTLNPEFSKRFQTIIQKRVFFFRIKSAEQVTDLHLDPDKQLGAIRDFFACAGEELITLKTDDQLYYVKGGVVGTSDIKDISLPTAIIFARSLFFVDENLTLKGKNLVVRAPSIYVKGEKTIDLSGSNGEDHQESQASKDQKGSPGKPGESGGHFNGAFDKGEISSLSILSNGGGGGKGQKGGNGSNGNPGAEGTENGVRNKECEPTHCPPFEYLYIHGTKGEAGKDGQVGGAGGKGGKAGGITLKVNETCKIENLQKKELEGGGVGAAGTHGKGGKGGKHGTIWEGKWFQKNYDKFNEISIVARDTLLGLVTGGTASSAVYALAGGIPGILVGGGGAAAAATAAGARALGTIYREKAGYWEEGSIKKIFSPGLGDCAESGKTPKKDEACNTEGRKNSEETSPLTEEKLTIIDQEYEKFRNSWAP